MNPRVVSMGAELETARRYRLHAEELRVLAESMELNRSRDVVLAVAEDYERMAKSLEAIDNSEVALHR
jgi:hypothetical protein